ncbi:hypothetical protein BGW39_004719 [Mortierella sp. 14UC]|nr:hypothetical protein BGW39_004719 [Mortierella sp. 14UC]
MIYRREGDNARSVVEVEPQGVSHTGDFIHVLGSVASIDFENKNFRVHFEFTAHGTLAGDDGVLAAAVSISVFYTTLAFPAGQIMRSVDVTMPYMQGATIDYPFDAYKSYFEILANKDREQMHKIPVSLTFLAEDTFVQTFGVPRFHTDAVREESYSKAMLIPKSIEVSPKSSDHQGRTSILVHSDPSAATDSNKREPYIWDFETYSQNNYYGDRQRFNGDGCVNFRCSDVRAFKDLTNKEYIFYNGDDCYGVVILRTTDEMMDNIKQPFKPCSIRV